MSGPLKLGFAPLTDAAPLIVAQVNGFFAAEDLEVVLSREASWATVRDKLAVGALDAAHMLAPMAVAASLGIGSDPVPTAAPLVMSRGGAAVTLSSRISGPDGPQAALARLVARRKAQGASRLTFAVVFPYALHNYLLRTWLTEAGVEPDADVQLTVAPPQRMAELLADGVIEGFCAGEPWGSAAVAGGVGKIAVRSGEVWPDAPDKVLGVTETWAHAQPDALGGLVRALRRAAIWCDDPVNRATLAALLAKPAHVGVAAELIASGLPQIRFGGLGLTAPSPADAAWLAGQMIRWGQADESAAAMAAQVFRGDLHDAAVRPASA